MAKPFNQLSQSGRWYRKNREHVLAQKRARHKARGGKTREELRAEEAERYYAILKLKKIKGQTFKSIGKQLGISRNAVSGLVWRAKNRLEIRA